MKKKLFSLLFAITVLLSALSVNMFTGAEAAKYDYTMIQDFESAGAATETATWAGGMDIIRSVETTEVNTGSQSLKLQMDASNTTKVVVNNIYPQLTINDWSGSDGISFWLKTGNCPILYDNGATVGRFESYFEAGGVRYSTAGGTVYLQADGATEETTATAIGDLRYIIPANFSGLVRIPFSTYSGWSESVDMSNISSFALGFFVSEYNGNTYYVDSLRTYTASSVSEEKTYDTTVFQDFESAGAATETATWAGGMDIIRSVETTEVNTGSQSLKLQMDASNTTKVVVNNIYPQLTINDWSGSDGISFWLKTGNCPVLYDNGATVGRFESYFEAGGVRYSTAGGTVYLQADGATEETTATAIGDLRYIIPANFSGLVRIPFSTYSGWSESVDMSNISSFALGFFVSEYNGNTYYVDTFSIYKSAASGEPEVSPSEAPEVSPSEAPAVSPSEAPAASPSVGPVSTNPLMIQDFEKTNVGECASRWEAGAAANLSLSGNGVDGSSSLKIDIGAPNGSQPSLVLFISLLNHDFSSGNTLMYYAENPSATDSVAIGLNLQESSGERWYIGENKKVYLIDAQTGEAQEILNPADGRVPIPAGFKGWVVVPKTSIKIAMWSLVDGEMDLSTLDSCLLDADTTTAQGKTIYLDELQMSTKSALEIINEFSSDPGEDSGSTSSEEPSNNTDPLMIQDFEKDNVNACASRWTDGAAADLSLSENGVNGSSSLKIAIGAPNGTQASMGIFISPINTNYSNGKTLMFYAENPSTAEGDNVAIGITLQEGSGERWYIGESKRIYLYNVETGETEEGLNGADARVIIPAGFKGWVIIPETSLKVAMWSLIDGEMDLSSMDSCILDSDTTTTQGKTVFLDEIKMNTKSALTIIDEFTNGTPDDSSSEDNSVSSDTDNTSGGNPETGDVNLVIVLFILLAAAFVCFSFTRKIKE